MTEFEKDFGTISLVFDNRAYSLAAVKKAAYKYLDRFSADISVEAATITCILRFTLPIDRDARAHLVEDFRKEVLDQDLRETLKAETETVRNLILAYAFSQTTIVGNEKLP